MKMSEKGRGRSEGLQNKKIDYTVYVSNPSKYQAMLISKKQEDDTISVNVQGKSIESVKSIKLLGVTIDDKLNFSGAHKYHV